jgi:hypothetical protein
MNSREELDLAYENYVRSYLATGIGPDGGKRIYNENDPSVVQLLGLYDKAYQEFRELGQ